eukprot:jgi/Mesen1/1808/ME000140S00761
MSLANCGTSLSQSLQQDLVRTIDQPRVERERGITVKAQTVSMLYDYAPPAPPGTPAVPGPVLNAPLAALPPAQYLLNLVDTPGHVDFSYEVSRSLAATQGVLLLVDAAQGIQISAGNYYLLASTPAAFKNPGSTKPQLAGAVLLRKPDLSGFCLALLGRLGKVCGPREARVGYVVTGMRSVREACIGDTLHHLKASIQPLPGFKAAKHMVYAGVYPADGSDYEALSCAVERLTCNDASVSVAKETSGALGAGFRADTALFLSPSTSPFRLLLLRLLSATRHLASMQEHGAQVISTTPTVPYTFEYSDGSKVQVYNPADVPSKPKHKQVAAYEPTVTATIITPSELQRAMLKYRLPLREVVTDFYNELKSLTSGYASFDYEDAGSVDVMLNGAPVDALAMVVHRSRALRAGRDLVERLKTTIDRQMFEVAIQAAVGTKVIARETLSAMRKNVLAKCYGGDVSRKRKLLEKQKEGKKRMKRIGSVDL